MNRPTSTLSCEQPESVLPRVLSPRDALSTVAQLCTRPQPRRGTAERVCTIVAQETDWGALLRAATDHGIAPLLCRRTMELAGDALPAEWHDRFRGQWNDYARRNFFLTAELLRVLRALESAGVQALPFKGPVLAQQAYGDLALRDFSDLDIVLPHSQIQEAHRAMERLGYGSETAAAAIVERRIPGQYAYRNAARATLVELHTERTMRYLPAPMDWKSAAARFETVLLGGQAVRTFSTEDTLLLVCVHGAKHFWTRLGWIGDVVELVQAPRGIDWPRAESLAREMRCRRMWLLGLALASQVLSAPLPYSVARQIRGDARVAALARRVREHYLHDGESAVNSGDRLRFRLHSQDTLATSLRQVRIFATRPTDADWQSCSLPRWAAPLYAALRPLRMLRAYGFRLREEQ